MTNFRDRKWPIPVNPSPLETLCYQIDLPNDPQFIAAFIGAVFELSYWFNFDTDPLKQGRLVAATWLKALNTLRLCQSSTPTGGGGGANTELMIRQNPTNPCLLESSLDGVTWCAFADLSKCFTSASQPGAGSPQPQPGGGTQQYCQTLQANGKLLLPTIVSAGDTLTLVSATGAGNDGGHPRWNCPDGTLFFAGQCSGVQLVDGADPLPTVSHMALIYNIAGTFYDATAGVVTVPAGVSNAQVYVQVNDADISNNLGSYDVCVTVKNNAVNTWTQSFDFALTDGLFVPVSGVSAVPGMWVAGVGWKPTNWVAGGADYVNGFDVIRSFAPTTITSIDFRFDLTLSSPPGRATHECYGLIDNTGVLTGVLFPAATTGNNQHALWNGSRLMSSLSLFVFADVQDAFPVGGDCRGASLVVSGVGVNPFI